MSHGCVSPRWPTSTETCVRSGRRCRHEDLDLRDLRPDLRRSQGLARRGHRRRHPLGRCARGLDLPRLRRGQDGFRDDRNRLRTVSDLLRVGATALKTSSASRLRLTRFSAARRASETSNAHVQKYTPLDSLRSPCGPAVCCYSATLRFSPALTSRRLLLT